MSSTITPERALEIARELWPWANYIACDSNWVTHAFNNRPEFDGCCWQSQRLLTRIGSNIAWPQDKIVDRLLGVEIVPTDEDAKRRPLVMVRDEDSTEWLWSMS